MKFSILTIFPEMFSGFLNESIIGRAVEDKKVEVDLVDIRKFSTDKHKNVDDRPYGGGAGMVMKPEPISSAIISVKKKNKNAKVIAMTPQGTQFCQKKAAELKDGDDIIFICGRYEGIDERVFELYVDEELSIGDYVLTGGEIPAMVVIDAVTRLIPGVLGCCDSTCEESFSKGRIEYPQYTRPYEFKGLKVPDVLLSGNHGEVEKWRKAASLVRTLEKRADMFFNHPTDGEEKKILSGLFRRLEDFVRK